MSKTFTLEDFVKNMRLPSEQEAKFLSSDYNDNSKMSKPEVGDVYQYNSGVKVEIIKVVTELDVGVYETQALSYTTSFESSNSMRWILNLNCDDFKLISRKPKGPSIVNPLYYPDHPETKEECDRAFDILRNMCRG